MSLSFPLTLLLLLLLMPCFPLGWGEWSSGERRTEGWKGGADWVEPADGRRSAWIATGLVDEDGVLVSLGNIACWLVQVVVAVALGLSVAAVADAVMLKEEGEEIEEKKKRGKEKRRWKGMRKK